MSRNSQSGARLRGEWQRRLTPLLDSLMHELCASQEAIISRDLGALERSVAQQVSLAQDILAANRAQRAALRSAMRVPHPMEADAPPADSGLAHLEPQEAAAMAAIASQFGASVSALHRETKVNAALLRRSAATFRALSNLYSLGTDTYSRPQQRAEMLTAPTLPPTGTAEGS